MPDQQELDKAQAEFHAAVENAQAMLNDIGASLHDAIRGVFTTAKQHIAPQIITGGGEPSMAAPIILETVVRGPNEAPSTSMAATLTDTNSPNEPVAAPAATCVETAPTSEPAPTIGMDTGSVASAEPTAN